MNPQVYSQCESGRMAFLESFKTVTRDVVREYSAEELGTMRDDGVMPQRKHKERIAWIMAQGLPLTAV
jgi:hypothetical protein